MKLGFGEYTRLADAVYNSFVFVKSDAQSSAQTLGEATPLYDGHVMDLPGVPKDLMGYVYQPQDSDWSMVELEGAHPGVPQLYSDFMQEWLPIPYDAENYYPEMDTAARQLTIPRAPLCYLTPLTTAAYLSEARDCEAVALWCLEAFSIFGAAFFNQGKYTDVYSAYGQDSYLHLTPTSQTECLGFLFEPLNELLVAKGIQIPEDNSLDPYVHFDATPFQSVVQVTTHTKAEPEVWAGLIDRYKATLPI